MRISDIFKQKRAVFSFEIFPPKPTADIAAVQGTIEELSALSPDYISVTCSAGGSGNSRTAEIAALVQRCGVEPLAHVTCINSDKAAVSATLDKLAGLGIRNVLALRGDRIAGAKIPAKISRMIARFYEKPDALMEAGIAYAVDQIVDLLSAGAQGIHLYVMNNPYVARRIAESIKPILAELNGG